MSNLGVSGHCLAIGGEVQILLSDLGRVMAKPVHDKGMIRQQVQTKQRQMP